MLAVWFKFQHHKKIMLKRREIIRLSAFFILAILFTTSEALSSDSVRIRVRLSSGVPEAWVRGMDLQIKNSEGNFSRPQDVARAQEWKFRCHENKVEVVQVGDRGQTLVLESPVQVASQAGFLQFNGRPFREEFRIFSLGSLCEVINILDVEKYLDGLVNSEFSSRWSDESIQAQIIAARSYAYYQIEQSRKLHYDVTSSVRDQVYDGSAREDSRASRLVAQTRGMVLMVPGKKSIEPLKAFYHSTCAGKTELPERVWGKSFPGFKQRVSCPFCANSPAFRWELDLSTSMIEERFRKGALSDSQAIQVKKGSADWRKFIREAALTDIQVISGASQLAGELGNRVSYVVTQWQLPSGDQKQMSSLAVSGHRFREWMGSTRLKSAVFEVKPFSSDQWHFRGRGYGHGVGMCQYGAKTMGEKGFTMAKILKHYYPDAVIQKLW